MKSSNFTIFLPPITNTRPYRVVTMVELKEMITMNARIKTSQEHLMEAVACGSASYKHAKGSMLPWFTVGGVFNYPNANGLLLPSCMTILDVDNLPTEKIAELKYRLFNDEVLNPDLVFTSPSGRGVKALISYAMPKTAIVEAHKDLTTSYMNYFDETFASEFQKADRSGSDITRRCFLCHDAEALFRENDFTTNFKNI